MGASLRVGLTVLCAVCAALAFAGMASATTFDCSGTPAGSCTNSKLAVDDATGDVYVIDSGHDVVDRFNSAGTYLSQIRGSSTTVGTFNFGGEDDIAVDNSGGPRQGDVYVVSENQSLASATAVFAFDARGRELWEHGGIGGDTCGVAVDGSGQLWGSDYNAGVQQLSVADGSSIGSPVAIDHGATGCEIAFDASNNLYVNIWHGTLYKYASGDYTTSSATLDVTPTFDVATDMSTGDVYSVTNNSEISAWDSSGSALAGSPFDTGSTNLTGVTADGAHGSIFVSDVANNDVQIFARGTGAPEPYVRTQDASSITTTDATFNGMVNPAGASTTCQFQYVDDAQFQVDGFASATSVNCDSAPGSGTSDVAAGRSVTGLTAGTTYHVRLVATNANGTNNGSDIAFKTAAPPRLLTVNVAGTGNGGVDADSGAIAACTRSGGTCSDSYADGTVVRLTATPSHSSVASWSGGGCSGTATTCDVTLSADTSVTVTFAQDVPTVGGENASGVTQTAATLAGTANPNGASTTCQIEWGTTTAYGTTTPVSANPGSGTSAVAVSIPALSGLTPNTPYHYRVDCTNAGGTTNGGDQTFRTTAIPVPTVVTGSASGVTQTGASLAGTVNPNGFGTTCRFEYGTTTAYGSSVDCAAAPGSGSSAVAASAALAGLTAGTTYHYRLVATNGGGSTAGADATFTTSSPTPAGCPQDVSKCPPGKLVLSTKTATVVKGKVALRVTCQGSAGSSCKGTLKLTAKVKKGKKKVTITVGTVKVSVAAGKSATLSVKLSGAAKSALAKSPHKLAVSATGSGVKKTVTLKQPVAKKKK